MRFPTVPAFFVFLVMCSLGSPANSVAQDKRPRPLPGLPTEVATDSVARKQETAINIGFATQMLSQDFIQIMLTSEVNALCRVNLRSWLAFCHCFPLGSVLLVGACTLLVLLPSSPPFGTPSCS